MPVLGDLCDLERLEAFVDKGLITRRQHPSEDLVVYDYTARANASRTWTPETRLCRGLVTTRGGEIVARPFPRFFNLNELEGESDDTPIRDRPFEVSEKLDGSLGILYPAGKGHCITTRGSFTSRQAAWATQHWHEHYAGLEPPAGITYLFEVIYPANRVVVNYGQFSGLVLLAAIDNRSGADVALPTDWPGPVVPRHEGISSIDSIRALALASSGSRDREGLVIRFLGPPDMPSARVKVKFAEYVRLHRMVTSVSTRTIWEYLANGRSIDELIERGPEDFTTWARDTAARLQREYLKVEARCRAELLQLPDGASRRDSAQAFARSGTNIAVLFKMLDHRPYDQLLWRSLRPEYDQPFRTAAR